MFFFFFQAEDGIRDVAVTGVQTCALPICIEHVKGLAQIDNLLGGGLFSNDVEGELLEGHVVQIGRASCRERV